MAPLKKASKKSAKKAAKKAAKYPESRDARRAYEHLGRIEILQRVSHESDRDVTRVAKLAQVELKSGNTKNSADLLRAAEHLSFARLGTSRRAGSSVSDDLEREILSEVEHLMRRAQEYGEEEGARYPELVALSQSMLEQAEAGLAKGAYRQSLELARGAEALTHVIKHGPSRLPAATPSKRLQVS